MLLEAAEEDENVIVSGQRPFIPVTSVLKIDAMFHQDIRYISHFQYLDGTCFKNMLNQMFATPPQLDSYGMDTGIQTHYSMPGEDNSSDG